MGLYLAPAIFTLSMAAFLAVVPITRLVEDVIYIHYYSSSTQRQEPIDERLCKVDGIQSELAYTLGILSLCSKLPQVGPIVPYVNSTP